MSRNYRIWFVLIPVAMALVGCGGDAQKPQTDVAVPAQTPEVTGQDKSVSSTGSPIPNLADARKPEPTTPIDSDADGVPDGRDQCKNTPAGTLVDADGCRPRLKQAKRFDLEVGFPSGSAKLVDIGDVSAALALLEQFPEAVLTVEGHSDSSGRSVDNQRLSQQRAEAVAQTLAEEFGVNPSRISALGHGDAHPIADNATTEGRAANRRVELIVSPTPQT